jgi:hypothetical protein
MVWFGLNLDLDIMLRLESILINFGWNWFYIKMNLGIIIWVPVHNYLSGAL